MLTNNIRYKILMLFVLPLPVFDAEREPPELHEHPLFVKVLDHALDGIAGKRVLARLPVAVVIEPAVVERGPFDSHFFELGNCSQHLRRRHVSLVTPSAPTDVVGLAGRLGEFPPFFLQHTRPQIQWLIKVSRIHGNETAGCDVALTGLEGDRRGDLETGMHALVGSDAYRERDCEWQSLDVANRFTDISCPECDHGDPASIAAFDNTAHDVRLKEPVRQLANVIFTP